MPQFGMYCETSMKPSCLFKSRYNEALLLFRSSSDTVWQAATLEGMATVSIIDAWSAGQGLVRVLFCL
jgi:hypothetical protein